MDAYKRLKTEFNGIKSIITHYTHSGDICNYLNQLENSFSSDDFETIIYCLDKIVQWYEDNYSSILSNNFVYDKENHRKNKAVVEALNADMKKYNLEHYDTDNNKKDYGKRKIFLSHSSSDIRYGEAIRKFLIGLGIKNDQLIYTSSPANKIPFGDNIYDYLRKNINSDVFVIILLSGSYLESVACLNEMGGAWVAKSDYLCFFTPDFDFSNPKYHQCAIDTRKMGAILKPNSNCRTSMIEFKNIICTRFDLTVEEKTFAVLIEEFIDSIR